MQAGKTKFHVGDWVVHAFYGIGKIIDQEKMKLSGKAQTFFTVKLKDGRYWLSKEKSQADHIRPLSSQKDFASALREIEKAPQALFRQYRSRKKEILDAVEEGALLNHVRLIRDLNGRKHRKKLNFEERNWLAKLKKQFIREWSLVTGKKKSTHKRELKFALNTSIKKSKEKE